MASLEEQDCIVQPNIPKKKINVHNTKAIVRGRLKGVQNSRLGRLFDMPYRTTELAEELGISPRQIRQIYVPLGCPHQRTSRNQIMINGVEFRDWYKSTYKRIRLSSDEAFCMTCRGSVKMENKTRHQASGMEHWLCDCPNCGRRLTKIIKRIARVS